MRALEITFLILTLFVLIRSLKNDGSMSFASSIYGCTFLVFVIHLIIEGWRWQMVPAYAAGIIILGIGVKRKFLNHDAGTQPHSRLLTLWKILFSGAGILLLIVSGVLSWALPVFKIPTPTGEYQVGTKQWYLMDKSRRETFTDNPDDYREISVWGWYPANVSGMSRRSEYLKNRRLTGKAVLTDPNASDMLGLTWLGEAAAVILFDDLRLVRTHSYQEAPVSQKKGPYPVLVFSHGYGAIAVQNTALMEELASHGYAVFSIGHTYESIVEIFPDGRMMRFSPKNEIDMTISNLGKGAEKIKTGDLEASIALMKKFNTPEAWGDSLNIWTADTQFVIDWLEKMNTDDPAGPFYGKLDLNKLGVFGMSFGGATASQVLFEDHRVKAAINLDGGLPVGDLIDRPLNKPYMYMNSEPSTALAEVNQTVFDYMMGRSDTAFYSMTVTGSKHNNFMDLSVYSPLLKYTGLLGDIDGYKMLKIMNAYALAFFNRHLKGIDSPLLDGVSSEFPEVILKTKSNGILQ